MEGQLFLGTRGPAPPGGLRRSRLRDAPLPLHRELVRLRPRPHTSRGPQTCRLPGQTLLVPVGEKSASGAHLIPTTAKQHGGFEITVKKKSAI